MDDPVKTGDSMELRAEALQHSSATLANPARVREFDFGDQPTGELNGDL